MSSINSPFKLASIVRYKYDQAESFTLTDLEDYKFYESFYANSGLRVSKELTPDLNSHLKKACSRLQLSTTKVKAFVIPRPDANASCIGFEKRGCVVALHSELFNMMSPGEIQFIMGHEIGHFLLNHNFLNKEDASEQEFEKSRAAEISCDRIGLIACRDINAAMKAMIRMKSGLNDQFLRFDTNAFLKDMETEKSFQTVLQKATHPSATIRAKSLLRFSLSDPYQKIVHNSDGKKLELIDNRIKKDLNVYLKRKVKKDMPSEIKNLEFWGLVYVFVKDGVLSKKEQAFLKKTYGNSRIKDLIKEIKNKSSKTVIQIAKRRAAKSCKNLKIIAPVSGWFSIRRSIKKIEKISHYEGLLDEIST